MNAGNRAKAWRKYLFSLPIIETRIYCNGEIKTELRYDEKEDYWVVIRYENDEYDMSIGTDSFPKDELIELYL